MNVKTIQLPFDAPLLPVKMLRSGSLSCLYEHGNLRYIKLGDVEIIRMIYTAVRDENWFTAPYIIEDEKLEENANGFVIHYTAIHQLTNIHYKSHIRIEAEGNSLFFSMEGEALSSFASNRIGICVLHPMNESMGKEVKVVQPGGLAYNGNFPELISPNQVFKNIEQMNWSIDESNSIQVNFEGDIFETEDQRNWSDNSFKTYSTPLVIPIPVAVKTGDLIKQKVMMRVSSNKLPVQKKQPPPSSQEKMAFPKIGYSRVNHQPLDNEQVQLLKAIPFDHYRVELELDHPDWQKELHTAISEAKQLNAELELVVYFGENIEEQLRVFVSALEVVKDDVQSILVLQSNQNVTNPGLLQNVYPVLKEINPLVKLGYGTDSAFAELNRNPPGELLYDFVNFSLHPQGHAVSTRTIIENLRAQAHTLKTLHASVGTGIEVHISPVRFKSGIKPLDDFYAPLSDYDARLHSCFGAAWSLLTLRNYSTSHITFYDAVGYRGLISTGINGNASSEFYKVLVAIKEFNPVWIFKNNQEDSADIVLENADGDQLIIQIDDLFWRCINGFSLGPNQ